MVPVANFGWDRVPFWRIVEPPDDGLDRPLVVLTRMRPAAIVASNFVILASVSTCAVSPLRCPMQEAVSQPQKS